MKRIAVFVFVCVIAAQYCWAARAKIDVVSRDPYAAALVVNADSGEILFEEGADRVLYPASVLKLMVLLVVLEQIEQQQVKIDEMVQVTEEAARMGGSQVYLDPSEQFSVEDLLYALMIQSANDAAVALAIHVSGSKEGFVTLMNKRAKELGMKSTQFFSVHGLPPSEGQRVDLTTARDLSMLCRELAKKQETFKYTSLIEREFRDGEFIMRTHNHLLKSVAGCDGFKTGYFKAAGFSMAVTAKREGVRVIAIVLGSISRKVRDAKAAALLSEGFSMISQTSDAVALKKTTISAEETTAVDAHEAEEIKNKYPAPLDIPVDHQVAQGNKGNKTLLNNGWVLFFLGVATGLVLSFFLLLLQTNRKSKKHHRLM